MEKKLPVLCIDIPELEMFEFAVKNERKKFCFLCSGTVGAEAACFYLASVALETKQLLSFVHV